MTPRERRKPSTTKAVTKAAASTSHAKTGAGRPDKIETLEFNARLEMLADTPEFRALRPPEGWTIEIIAEVCEVSIEAIRVIQARAVAKMQRAACRRYGCLSVDALLQNDFEIPH
jgi:DNA-directed RNA polymerase specialized sigma24 family protein